MLRLRLFFRWRGWVAIVVLIKKFVSIYDSEKAWEVSVNPVGAFCETPLQNATSKA